jgi:hypothetical protein
MPHANRRLFLQPSTGRHAPLHAPTPWWVPQPPLLYCCIAGDALRKNCVKGGAQRDRGRRGAEGGSCVHFLLSTTFFHHNTPTRRRPPYPHAPAPTSRSGAGSVEDAFDDAAARARGPRSHPRVRTASAHGRPLPFPQPVRQPLMPTTPPPAPARQPTTPMAGARPAARVAGIVHVYTHLRPGPGLTRDRRVLARAPVIPCPTAMVAGQGLSLTPAHSRPAPACRPTRSFTATHHLTTTVTGATTLHLRTTYWRPTRTTWG